MRLRRSMAAALAFSLWLSPLLCLADGISPTAAAYDYPPYLIGPGDFLSISVYGEKDLPTEFLVDSAGSVLFPLIGDVKLGGLTPTEASRVLAAGLSKYQREPQVNVLIKDTTHYTISVLGDVIKPGKYRIRGKPTLLSVLAEAGGPNEMAALNDTRLIRGTTRQVLPLGHLLYDQGTAKEQPLLYPGDVIMVPRSPWPSLRDWSIIMGIITSAVLLSYTLQRER